ncbi:MAG: hypothetical protein COB82_10105, partial [Marinobacter sp.]
ALYCLRFLLMILLLVEMMNQSLGTCPNFGVHFTYWKLGNNGRNIPAPADLKLMSTRPTGIGTGTWRC